MASSIASSFAGVAVKAAKPTQRRTASARVSVVPRAALEAQRMATPFDGWK